MPARVILAWIISSRRDDIIGTTMFDEFHRHATAACTPQVNKNKLVLVGYDHGKNYGYEPESAVFDDDKTGLPDQQQIAQHDDYTSDPALSLLNSYPNRWMSSCQ